MNTKQVSDLLIYGKQSRAPHQEMHPKEKGITPKWFGHYGLSRYQELADFFGTEINYVRICCKVAAKEFTIIWDRNKPNRTDAIDDKAREERIIYTYREGSDHLVMRQMIPRVRILHMYEDILNTIISDKKYKILDYGCGVGDTALIFKEHEVTLVEIDESCHWDFIKWRLEKRNIKEYLCDIKYGLPENYFDIVITIDVLEHCLDPIDVLDKISNSMKKGGILFLSYSFAHVERAHLYQAADKEVAIQKYINEKFTLSKRIRGCGIWRKK